MYVYYSEEEYNAEIHGRRLSWSGPERTFRRAKRAWMVLLAVCGFAFAILLVSATIMNRFKGAAQTWADLLGVAVACLACVQWIPQTWTTWNLKSLGSLSLLSLCLMTPVGELRVEMLAILEDLLTRILLCSTRGYSASTWSSGWASPGGVHGSFISWLEPCRSS